jgi:hypothetical protein
MRYPFGENYKHDKNIINEAWFTGPCAGTDHPYYEDEDTGEIYEANWDDGDGFPFGYWPVNTHGTEEFFTGDYGETHAEACGKAAQKYFFSIAEDIVSSCADDICYSISDIADEFKEYGYKYNEEDDNYVSSDGSITTNKEELSDRVLDNINDTIGDVYEYVEELIEDFLENGTVPTYDDVLDKLNNDIENDYYFYNKETINEALNAVGSDFDDFFGEGHGEGRIWPEKKMIGFYDTEQPTPEELSEILYELADVIGCKYEDFMDYHMIYEDYDDDYDIKMVTLDEYIYGTHDENKQYAKDGKTVFIPHLAKPEEKFNFFKDFRKARDNAVYVPREKAAGSLAAYHAMRYPFGENKKRIWKQVSEEVDRVLSSQKRIYINESALKRVIKNIKK